MNKMNQFMNMSLAELDMLATEYAEKYVDRYQKVAKKAFMEGVLEVCKEEWKVRS